MKAIRFPWFLLTGLVIGLGLGLLFSWFVYPVSYADTAPHSIQDSHKDQARILIASAYTATGDLRRAQARLTLLGDPDPMRSLAAQAQRLTAQGGSRNDAIALARLAAALANTPGGPP